MSAPPNAGGLVCLGASAGGLRSLEAVVSRLPSDFPWPVLISQHLQADRVSQMPQILTRFATLPIREAVDGETPQAGVIYTSPSSSELGVSPEGTLALRPPVAGKPQRIDHLFATAAFTMPGRVVAVILSGTGSDGAAGSLVVKLNGGTVIAESNDSAQFTGMPAAARRAGTVDATLPADDVAALLMKLARGGLDEANATTHAILGEIAKDIAEATGTDFARYRTGTLRRRAENRRAIVGDATLTDYRARLAKDPSERDALVRSLLIPVTQFFRDPPAWQALEEYVIPVLAERARAGRAVRVWCAGCATGEEAYSIAILLSENIADRSRVQILATDLAPDAILAATTGDFDAARMAGVDDLRRERFFRAKDEAFVVKDDLRKMIEFRTHDLTHDPSPGQFDLIACRNLLIYFDEALQGQTVSMFRDALAGEGFLFLGRSEAIPQHHDAFDPVVRAMRIFRSKGPATGTVAEAEGTPRLVAERQNPNDAATARVEEADVIIFSLDETWRILTANARSRALLNKDVAGLRLLDVFPSWQGSPVHDALRASLPTGRSVKVRGAPTPWGLMDLTLEPHLGSERGALLIGTPAQSRPRPARGADLVELREDLAATTDELQSANEELVATNEELQAANEELASLNEEFQSTNQSLASSNVELGAVAQIAQSASNLVIEILQARREALVACDAKRRVTFVNRKAGEAFGLDGTSVGRTLAVALAPLAIAPDQVEKWLDDALLGIVRQEVEHRSARFDLVVEALATPAGSPLGWVLAWTPVA